MTSILVACETCKRFWGWRSCEAFPREIPDIIWREGDPHTKPVEGDNGITYEPFTNEDRGTGGKMAEDK